MRTRCCACPPPRAARLSCGVSFSRPIDCGRDEWFGRDAEERIAPLGNGELLLLIFAMVLIDCESMDLRLRGFVVGMQGIEIVSWNIKALWSRSNLVVLLLVGLYIVSTRTFKPVPLIPDPSLVYDPSIPGHSVPTQTSTWHVSGLDLRSAKYSHQL